jgi:hypothetical protein
MMSFAVTTWEIGILSAACAVVILMASEMISPHYGRTNILLDQRKLRIAAAAFMVAFMAIGIVNVVTLVSG